MSLTATDIEQEAVCERIRRWTIESDGGWEKLLDYVRSNFLLWGCASWKDMDKGTARVYYVDTGRVYHNGEMMHALNSNQAFSGACKIPVEDGRRWVFGVDAEGRPIMSLIIKIPDS